MSSLNTKEKYMPIFTFFIWGAISTNIYGVLDNRHPKTVSHAIALTGQMHALSGQILL